MGAAKTFTNTTSWKMSNKRNSCLIGWCRLSMLAYLILLLLGMSAVKLMFCFLSSKFAISIQFALTLVVN